MTTLPPVNTASDIEHRKAEHLRVCLEEDVEFSEISSGLEKYRFNHCCLPELDRGDINIGTSFLGKTLGAPLLISSMTGGTTLAHLVNTRLATVAQRYRLAMGVGSQRIALEQPELAATFSVRHLAPDILLLANLGAVQLNYGCGVEECLKLVDLLEADALILHLNPLQEWVQSGGDKNFRGLIDKIALVCSKLPVPVVAKEVGNGISRTSWAKVESQRAKDKKQRHLGQVFADWGLPTADCITSIRAINSTIPLIASGGLKNGVDIGKAIALGADLGGLARPFLIAAVASEAAVDELVTFLIAELEIALFCTGNANLSALKNSGSLSKIWV